jgi:phage terminase large subunit GpA-like protein
VPDKTIRNECLDTMNQAEAAAILWGVRSLPEAVWDRLETERETPPAEAQLDLEDPISVRTPAPLPVAKQQNAKVNRWRNRR